MLHLWDVTQGEEAMDPEPGSGKLRNLRNASPSTLPGSAARLGLSTVEESLELQQDAIGILGHELRNPLSAIVALARGLMNRGDLPADANVRLAQIDRAAQR